MTASVKVMRSYDYCHFEVSLGSECEDIDAVNELRRQAAILADEAVREYILAKKAETRRQTKDYDRESMLNRLKALKEIPESELTPEQAAILRGSADADFWKQFNQDDYYYQSDGEREYHFSMLYKFKRSRVRPS